MKSYRSRQVGELLRRELALVMNLRSSASAHSLCTVTEVRVTRDMRYADVWISVRGETEQRQQVLAAVCNSAKSLRQEVAARVYLRKIPELRFKLDETLDYALKIERLLDQDRNKKAE